MKRLFDIRTGPHADWYYHRSLGFLGCSSWCYFSLRHPVWTAKWWWDHAVANPKRRGWRWD